MRSVVPTFLTWCAMPSSDAASRRIWRTHSEPSSDGWHFRAKIGRLQVGAAIYRHGRHNGHLGQRWVVQPWLTYDRKALV